MCPSTKTTIQKRSGKVKGLGQEIRGFSEEYRFVPYVRFGVVCPIMSRWPLKILRVPFWLQSLSKNRWCSKNSALSFFEHQPKILPLPKSLRQQKTRLMRPGYLPRLGNHPRECSTRRLLLSPHPISRGFLATMPSLSLVPLTLFPNQGQILTGPSPMAYRFIGVP